ncbi:endospore germination permease [Paenibacillus sp. LHD-38]|uniref:GerAB/ArcD/ProY family transporter n=1 Tax=Paenibacillus sp. LHD-38 TaxID=3072143 RepID=UPI00280DDEAF|nr:endospore germination permease [Paenibacillus sp. LHD-38]MDQ8734178.1 endospore germination permease [Paenibacillus sp. LHD-38]
MLEKGKISGVQMALMLYPTVLATGFLALPTITSQYAQNDFWMTGILSLFMGLITVYTAVRLHELYPNENVIQHSERIAGKLAGKIIGTIFFLYSIHGTGAIVRQYAEFVTGNFLFKTPILLIISSMVLLASIAVRGGLETMARSAVIFTPIFIFPLLFLLLLIPDLDVRNIFPILSHGIIPVLKGTATPQAWVSELFFMTFFLPCLTDPDKGRKWGNMALGAIVLSMAYVNLFALFLLGQDTGDKAYPILVAFRYISAAGIFENLESLLLAMWVVGNFVKICVFFYAAVLSLSQTLRLSDYRPTVFPLGILAIVFSLWDLPSLSRIGIHNRYTAPFEIPAVLTFIPLLLLVIHHLRGIRKTRR